VHWGREELKLNVAGRDKLFVRAFKLGPLNPSTLQGELGELKTDMTIEPTKAELVILGAWELDWGEKLQLRQEFLSPDPTEAL
jgi:hypothetical protein